MAVAKEQIRQIISQNNISSVADVYSFSKKASKIFYRSLWKQNSMPSSVMRKIKKVIF